MLSRVPIVLEKVAKEDWDKEILRTAIIAELDAINLYEQMAGLTQNAAIKKVLFEVAREEKTHTGEFQALLLKLDPQQEKELEAGEKEVKDLISP